MSVPGKISDYCLPCPALTYDCGHKLSLSHARRRRQALLRQSLGLGREDLFELIEAAIEMREKALPGLPESGTPHVLFNSLAPIGPGLPAHARLGV